MVCTEGQMRSVMEGACPQVRWEGEIVPEGLSLTTTPISEFWYYREGKYIAVLHERKKDGHICFETQVVDG
jgi:hypothetical protein